MPTVGEQLRAAREARRLRVQEVAEATNMRTDHILALEDGNYAPFPAPVYIRGSVRTYAKLLKLDVMALMDQLSREINAHDPAADAASGRTGRRRGLLDFASLQLARFGWKRSLILLLVLGATGVLLLIRSALHAEPRPDPLADLPPPTYQPPPRSDGGYLPLPGPNR